MHSCKNNTGENVSHLEQMVNGFLPYSQQQLGFDKPVKIVLQSDPSNADVLLGKTAHYNPETFEVYIYTDKRHPKDIMRSLSHELVHHAQNCRGDFGSCNATGLGYAQKDPHLRKMEREAYTKGNLIFRDFEDLIKRGKITIDINFKDSGEPQMSLKEWKDNELNTLLMKKWGLLSEGTDKEHEDEEGNRPSMAKDMDLDEEADHPGQSCDEAHPGEKHPVEESYIDLARSRGQLHKAIPASEEDHKKYGGQLPDEMMDPKYWHEDDPETYRGPAIRDPDDPPAPGRRITDPRDLKRTTTKVPPVSVRGIEEVGAGDWAEMADEEDPTDLPPGNIALDRQAMAQANKGARVSGKKLGKLGAAGGRRRQPGAPGAKNVFTTEGQTSGKISVREAKQITRRIIERIRKEGK